jgi:hypothetical protein
MLLPMGTITAGKICQHEKCMDDGTKSRQFRRNSRVKCSCLLTFTDASSALKMVAISSWPFESPRNTDAMGGPKG